MTRPMSDSEICDMIEALSADLIETRDRVVGLEQTVEDLRNRVNALEQAEPCPAAERANAAEAAWAARPYL